MKDLKFIIGKNINHLRTKKGITQQQLGEQLNYSDKTISKWERGESLPDIVVLKNLADFFQVSLDYLVEETHKIKGIKQENLQKENRRNSYIITISSIFMVFLAAILLFVILKMVIPGTNYPWLCYAYAIPAAIIVWLVFNSIWFNPRKNYLIISALVWSLLVALYFTFFVSGYKIWQLFLVGIPAQAIIVIWSKLRNKPEVME
ncbi:MAG: helix-turn-helix transcriptional regulator [Lachnospiraceae bacterium]|nr:helix-turn-helix transcriptional regulator [Lachnospiraceae bacterium]